MATNMVKKNTKKIKTKSSTFVFVFLINWKCPVKKGWWIVLINMKATSECISNPPGTGPFGQLS